jgi:branched-subunit amino acid aminotransferase/4-amino-4-deoxychorismate lyase
MPRTDSGRTTKIWRDGKLVNWKDATIHVMSHVVHQVAERMLPREALYTADKVFLTAWSRAVPASIASAELSLPRQAT